jgi:hypothetical protein
MQKKGTRDERMNHVSIWNIPDQREQAVIQAATKTIMTINKANN